MHVIQCPERQDSPSSSRRVKVFLAGGITNCPDWQKDVINALKDVDVILFNPRRDQFDMTAPESVSRQQIEWEYDKLKLSDIIFFWFPKESICPIALLELGRCIGGSPLNALVIGTHQKYPRRFDVVEQTRLANRGSIYDTLDTSIDELKKRIKTYAEWK